MKLNNKYYILRHGEAKSNVEDTVSCWPEKFENPLTQAGVHKIKNVAGELKNKKIDLIFSSDILRAKETAGIVSKELGISVNFDERLRELHFGTFNCKPEAEFMGYFNSPEERVRRSTPGGESYTDALKRIWNFFKEINKKYKGKNILIVSHQAPILLLLGKINGYSISESMIGMAHATGEKRMTKGELVEVN